MTSPEALGQRRTSAAVANDVDPWPGLESFRESDARFFLGRTAEANALEYLVCSRRLSVLFGLSGMGKSSLLQAGLFPRLRARGFLPVPLRLALEKNSPGVQQQVLAALRDAADKVSADLPMIGNARSLWEYFHLRNAVIWGADNRPLRPVLVFDQFEEMFTRGRTWERRLEALEEISDLAEGRMPVRYVGRRGLADR